MSQDECTRMELLIQAELDGELGVAEAAELAAHLAGCARCSAQAEALHGLSRRLRALPMEAAPSALRSSITDHLALPAAAPRLRPPRVRFAWLRPRSAGLGFAAGLAAAALAFVLIPTAQPGLVEALVAGHVRALQPGHLTDVLSTDRHTVKPWFDGRIDYAPPVRDLSASGFPLIGGRLDDLTGRPVAAMAYRRGQHIIDLYVWPGPAPAATSGSRQGYNWRAWGQNGMSLWAVSDVEAGELAAFQQAWMETR